MVMSPNEEIMAVGVPRLLESLSDLIGESIYLWYVPDPFSEDTRWRVWAGAPSGSGGSEWGKGTSPYRALHAAYMNVVEGVFVGRIDPDKKKEVSDA